MQTRRRALRYLLIPLSIIASFCFYFVFLSWSYSSLQLAIARSKGIYPTAEQGMLERASRGYAGVPRVDILYAGPNSFDGSKPHVWYVIAEVRAQARSDGSELGRNGCDAPGSFFLQTKEGWVHVSEGAFPGFVGFWMDVFGMAGPGEENPSVDWSPSQPARFCQSA